MRSVTRQPLRLSLLSYEVGGTQAALLIQRFDVRPGRSDIPVGLPETLLLPDEFWIDDDVSDFANARYAEFLKRMDVAATRLWLDGQPTLFPL